MNQKATNNFLSSVNEGDCCNKSYCDTKLSREGGDVQGRIGICGLANQNKTTKLPG